jgi:hypothetical protein
MNQTASASAAELPTLQKSLLGIREVDHRRRSESSGTSRGSPAHSFGAKIQCSGLLVTVDTVKTVSIAT